MTEEQFNKCLTCLNRRRSIFDKNTICNLRNKDLNFIGECKDYYPDNNAKLITENQNVFKLYKKLKEPFIILDNTFYITAVSIFLMVVLFVLIEFYKFEQLEPYFKTIFFAFMIYYIVVNIQNLRKVEKINAEFLGQLIIDKDKIQVLNERINLSNIEKMNFYNWDFVGRSKVWQEETFYLPKLSNGINNSVIIELVNGKNKKLNFSQKTKDDLLRNREILIHYHIHSKLNFDDLIRILHINKKKDIQSIKNEIEKKKNALQQHI